MLSHVCKKCVPICPCMSMHIHYVCTFTRAFMCVGTYLCRFSNSMHVYTHRHAQMEAHMCVDVVYAQCSVDICGVHASWNRCVHVCARVYLYDWVTVHM